MIEAGGTSSGVVTSTVSVWQAWGEMKGVDYGEVADSAAATPTETDSALGTRLLKRTSPYMRGDDVKALQAMLNVLGFDCRTIDGIFGNKTRAGVIAFQQAKGLAADGIVGSLTRAALLAA